MRAALACLTLLCPLPSLAQDAPFAIDAGYYHDVLMPPELACPTSGWLLADDGQLLARGLGATGVSTTEGFLCDWAGADHAICARGSLEEARLVVPALDGREDSRRLTILPEGYLSLTRADGGGRPTLLRRCPATFPTVLPSATPEAFAAAPPPVRRADPTEGPWAQVPQVPLPVEGVFAIVPRTAQSAQLLEMMTNIPPEQLAAVAVQHGLDPDAVTPETIVQLFETETCRTQPYVVTASGQMLDIGFFGAPQTARIDGISTCVLENDRLTCTQAEKSGGGFMPGARRQTSWLWALPDAGGPVLCNPDLGRDHPNSCSQLVACPAETLAIPFKDGGDVGALTGWWPGD